MYKVFVLESVRTSIDDYKDFNRRSSKVKVVCKGFTGLLISNNSI